ncbi:putative inactive glycosyltransferase 25 family member 3 [Convolutriloba macropyga]|uniref:putative inactive glycosyltransferase 25 family member 3 n=1 Tax=Convolutriloba macropyga TaxID=536237 RepID=UPI003F521FCE
MEKELGRVFTDMNFSRVTAVDSWSIDAQFLKTVGVRPMEDENVKLGEVGCFLSHRKIWTEIVENRLALTLILEDDVQFATSNGDVEEFRTQLDGFVKEFVRLDGDLLYLGRQIKESDVQCSHCRQLVKPSYSYGSYAYLLSLEGARKLLSTDVLANMIAVDEYLSLMFDENPRFDSWNLSDDDRSIFLDAYSVPLEMADVLWYMTDGTKWLLSDTEESVVINVTKSSEDCGFP